MHLGLLWDSTLWIYATSLHASTWVLHIFLIDEPYCSRIYYLIKYKRSFIPNIFTAPILLCPISTCYNLSEKWTFHYFGDLLSNACCCADQSLGWCWLQFSRVCSWKLHLTLEKIKFFDSLSRGCSPKCEFA